MALQRIHKFGSNPNLTLNVEEDIWYNGGIYPWPSAARRVRVKAGGNVADTAAGAGARSVVIVGLDENWSQVEETLVTAGASASAWSTTTFLRVYRVYVSSVGTYLGTNTGDIVVEHETTLAVLANLQASGSQTQLSQFTTPGDKACYITRISGFAEASKPMLVTGYIHENNVVPTDAPLHAKRVFRRLIGFAGFAQEDYSANPIYIPPRTDIWFSSVAGANGDTFSVHYDIILYDL